MSAAVVIAIAAAFSALFTAITNVLVIRGIRTKVEDVHQDIKQVQAEVKTANGLTIAALADRQEGRRIESDIPAAERTSSESHYVEQLKADAGNKPKESP